MSKKKPVVILKTREELETAMGDYTAAVVRHNALKAKMDAEIAVIKERYQEAFTKINEGLGELADGIEMWATLHPDEFSVKRSIDLLQGRIGYRQTPPSVGCLRGVKEDAAAILLQEAGHGALIRENLELNKDSILANYSAGEITDDELKKYGLRVKQEDKFFIEPDESKIKPQTN